MILPTHPLAITAVIVLTVIFQASSSYAFFVRDADGAWSSVSWEKRSNPGDLLKIPLTNNNDKSYSVRHLTTLSLLVLGLHLTLPITGCGADGYTLPRHQWQFRLAKITLWLQAQRLPGNLDCSCTARIRIINSSLLKLQFTRLLDCLKRKQPTYLYFRP